MLQYSLHARQLGRELHTLQQFIDRRVKAVSDRCITLHIYSRSAVCIYILTRAATDPSAFSVIVKTDGSFATLSIKCPHSLICLRMATGVVVSGLSVAGGGCWPRKLPPPPRLGGRDWRGGGSRE